MAFSPVTSAADGSRKGGLCAALGEQGEVALVGLDTPNRYASRI
jgi:hypothetical protein